VVVITLQVLSGLAIYKPVQLHWLLSFFGGYDAARVIHLLGLVLIAMFVVNHVVLVLLHPRDLLAMITGGERG
jgi:thiosulfate reductase cytochrome b subunit